MPVNKRSDSKNKQQETKIVTSWGHDCRRAG